MQRPKTWEALWPWLCPGLLGSWRWGGAERGGGGALAHLRVGDGLQLGRPELAQLLLVLPQVCLAADEHRRDPTAEVGDLREPLWKERVGIRAGAPSVAPPPEAGGLGEGPYLDENVVIAGGVHDVIADEHELGVLIGEGPQPVIIFLP